MADIQGEMANSQGRFAEKAFSAGKGLAVMIFEKLPKFPRDFPETITQDNQGKQTLKNEVKDKELIDIPINKDNIKDFESTARKHKVDYTLKKVETPLEDGSVKESYLVYFQAKDSKKLNAAMKAYSKRIVDKSKKPSLEEKLKRTIELAKSKDKERGREKSKTREAVL